jgi:hypothetical protein
VGVHEVIAPSVLAASRSRCHTCLGAKGGVVGLSRGLVVSVLFLPLSGRWVIDRLITVAQEL